MKKREVIGKGRAAEVMYWGNSRVLKLFYKNIPSNIIDNQFKEDTLIMKTFPNCPKAFKKIEENGRIGILYEYIEGITLNEFMRKKKANTDRAGRFSKAYNVFLDRKSNVHDGLQVSHAIPSKFLINREGNIIWQYIGTRKDRPSIELIIEAIENYL